MANQLPKATAARVALRPPSHQLQVPQLLLPHHRGGGTGVAGGLDFGDTLDEAGGQDGFVGRLLEVADDARHETRHQLDRAAHIVEVSNRGDDRVFTKAVYERRPSRCSVLYTPDTRTITIAC